MKLEYEKIEDMEERAAWERYRDNKRRTEAAESVTTLDTPLDYEGCDNHVQKTMEMIAYVCVKKGSNDCDDKAYISKNEAEKRARMLGQESESWEIKPITFIQTIW